MSARHRRRVLSVWEQHRAPLFKNFPESTIDPSWQFRRVHVTAAELGGFAALSRFFGPSIATVCDYAAILRIATLDLPTSPPDWHSHNRARALGALDTFDRGSIFNGFPIAIRRAASTTALLVEGYTRSTVAIWRSLPAVEVCLCKEP